MGRTLVGICLVLALGTTAEARSHRGHHHHAHHVHSHHVRDHVRSQHTYARGRVGRVVLASWYHEGSLTATGEHYNPDGLTAAHRSLPFGTKLRVTNLGNKKSVEVRVNDRGPARWTGKTIDLSRGAANALNMITAGVARVTYQIIHGGSS